MILKWTRLFDLKFTFAVLIYALVKPFINSQKNRNSKTADIFKQKKAISAH